MDNYKIIRNIGDGGFASVKQAIVKTTGEVVAIKKLNQKFYSWEECLELREIKVLRKTVHPNIVKLKEAVRVNDDLYLVFEYCEKSVYNLIKESIEIEEQKIREVIKDTLTALAELHRNGFFHRDVKPENILIQGSQCKLADFGLAKEIRCQPPFTEYVSTRWYRAPEIILRSRKYSWQADMFAVGCIMAELYTRLPLFPGCSEMDQLARYCSILGAPEEWAEGSRLASQLNFCFPHLAGVPLSQIMPSASPEAIDFMYSVLTWDPRLRPSAENCLQHPFFHKRNLSSCNANGNASTLDVRNSPLMHSSSVNYLSPGFKPQPNQRNDGLRKIGATLVLGQNFRSKS
jgi:protein kinase